MARAPWIADVLRSAGLNVVEQPGWHSRGKELDSIEGVLWHHTASPTSTGLATNLSVVINGNSVAPGPIANLLLWRDGTFHVVADGRCNHAGKGFLPYTGTDRGNACLLSIEAVNNGVGEPWSEPMLEAYEIGTAAILRHLDLPADRVATHWEYATPRGRKIDPAGPCGGRFAFVPGTQTWQPESVRAAIRFRMAPPPPPPIEVPDPQPPTEEADDMPVLHLITPNKGEWLWTPGGEPQPLKSVADGVALITALGSPKRVNISDAQLVALQNERPA